MKKLIDLGSLGLIALALILIGYSVLPHRPAGAADPAGRFVDFPVGAARLINLTNRREALDGLTPREQLDQMRDWLLFVAASSAGLTPKEINEAFYDLPAIRHSYMKPVANFEYGDTRAGYIGNGQVIALIPADNSEERYDRLARLVDEQRKNLGEKPETLIIFDYDLKLVDHPTPQTALLTRRENLKVKDLYTSAAGYYEAKIDSLADLERFMGQIDDLTFASLKDGLTLGGRKVKGQGYRGIRVEEIATLYQSEAKLREARNALQKKEDDFNARWSHRTYRTESEKAELMQEYLKETAALNEEIRQAHKAGNLVGSSGFSLDPTYNYAALLEEFDKNIAPRITRVLFDSQISEDESIGEEILPELRGPPGIDSVQLKTRLARDGLVNHDVNPLLALLSDLASTSERGADTAREIQSSIQKSYTYQAARYNGELRGTETGMVLFYTDLLAKMWAMNFQNSAPGSYIDEFCPMTALRVPPVYIRETHELSNTRLWFGMRDSGFQIANNGQQVLFARNSTRVYAASSSSLKPGIETSPTAQSAAFLDWWDDHYNEIARFEPEYERLNQIMKWSVVITWLNHQQESSKLNFLQTVSVERGYWFSDWVKQRPLRYQAWDKISFYPRGFNGATTELLSSLESKKYWEFGYETWFVGGVSLAAEKTVANRATLSADSVVAPSMRRSNLNYAPSESTGSTLKTFEGTSFKFTDVSAQEAVTTAAANPGARLRGRSGEIPNELVGRSVVQGIDGLSIGTQVGNVPYGELTIGKAENGFSVGWRSRDMDTGMRLGRQLSESADPARLLAHDPSVEVAIAQPGDVGYFVKLRGSQRWLKVTREGESSSSATRVSGLNERSQTYSLSWVDAGEVSGNTLRRIENTEKFGSIEQIQTGNYRPALRELVSMPDEVKVKFDAHLRTSLDECRTMMMSGRYDRASRQLDELIQIYGPREELKLYKAVSELNVPVSTRDALAELVSKGNRPSLMDELNLQLKERLKLKHDGETLTLVREGDHVALRYDLRSLDGSETLTRSDIQQAKLLVYYEDAPGLSNLDWQISPQRTLDAAIGGELKVVKLPRGDVTRLRPGVIYDQASGIKYKAAQTSSPGSGFRQPLDFVIDLRFGTPGAGGFLRRSPSTSSPLLVQCVNNDAANDEDDEENNNSTVLVLIRK